VTLTALTRIALIRHGETEWNLENRTQGSLDSPLSARGRAQALSLAQALAGAGVSRLVSSDLGRAIATAEPIARACGLALQVDSRFRERHYGCLEGLTWPQMQARYPDEYARLQARDPDFVPPGGESLVQFRDRVMAALGEIATRSADAHVAVVTHGGVIGIVYRHVQSIPLEAPRDYPLANASINRFRVADARWHLEAWGDVGHLEVPPDPVPGAGMH
jgi:probable phosphoglycerate mutase